MADDLDLNEELRVVTQTINRGLPPAPTIKPIGNGQRHETVTPAYDFEQFGRKLADGLVQAARDQLVAAENMVKQTEAFAEDVRVRIAEKARELHDMNERLRDFGANILKAHERFSRTD